MRVTIITPGTRGDVQPYLGLADGLRRAGHEVKLATHDAFAGLVRDCGFGFARLGGDPTAMFRQDRWTAGHVDFRFPARHARVVREVFGTLLAEVRPEEIEAALEDTDAAIVTMTSAWAAEAAQARGIRVLCATYSPFARTAEFSHCVVGSGARRGRLLNRLSYPVGQKLLGEPMAEPVKPWSRARAGLCPVPGFGSSDAWPPLATLHGFSEHVVARPRDWAGHLRVTGYWFAPPVPGAALGTDLDAFIDAGAPPVYVGFGSMPSPDPAALARTVVEAAGRAGIRVILDAGWSGLTADADDVHVLRAGVSHDLLFDRVAAVVHHGGASTTAAGLRAGRPTLVAPFVFDQRFWGRQVARIGAGPDPLPRRDLDTDALVERLRALSHPAIVEQARTVGEQIRAEDGPAVAAGMLDELLR